MAIADTMSFLNDTVLFTVGGRHQRVEQDAFSTATGLQTSSYGAEAYTPLAGLVVKPLQNVSLYANYAEGLSQGIIVAANFREPGRDPRAVQVEAAGSRRQGGLGHHHDDRRGVSDCASAPDHDAGQRPRLMTANSRIAVWN